MAQPLVASGRVIGVMGLFSLSVKKWTDEEINLSRTVSTYLALIMENSERLRELESANTQLRELLSGGTRRAEAIAPTPPNAPVSGGRTPAQ